MNADDTQSGGALAAEQRWPICEGLVVTADAAGQPHLAPMGPYLSSGEDALIFRPFRTSRTYEHLKRDGHGVFHVTDDVELLAHAAVGAPLTNATFRPLEPGPGWMLESACRWFAFRITVIDDSAQRSVLRAQVTSTGRLREFFGFNRAKHAVLEAAILATRVGILPAAEIEAELARLRPLVDKTGAPAEHRAFQFLTDYIARR